MGKTRLSFLAVLWTVLLGFPPAMAQPASGTASQPSKDLWYFVVDRSGSIGSKNLVAPFHNAIVNFVNTLDAGAQVEIVFFSDAATNPRSYHPLDLRAKGDFDRYFTESMKPGGQTLLYDTVANVLSRVKANEATFRRITVVILSDGEDNQSKNYKSWAELEKLLPRHG